MTLVTTQAACYLLLLEPDACPVEIKLSRRTSNPQSIFGYPSCTKRAYSAVRGLLMWEVVGDGFADRTGDGAGNLDGLGEGVFGAAD